MGRIGPRAPLVTVALAAALALSASASGATWPYVIHRVTDDTLTQEAVCASGWHLMWKDALETYHDDGTVTHSPYAGRYLDRLTGRRATFESMAEGSGIAFLSAGGDWAVYVREDETGIEATATIRAWNAATGARTSFETTPAIWGPPTTDGTLVTWLDADTSVVVAPLAGGPVVRLAEYVACTPAIDDGRVCWAERGLAPPDEMHAEDIGEVHALAGDELFMHDTATGTTVSTHIEGFSALDVDISGPIVVATGETSDYRSHLYVWDTRTGVVTRAYSAYPDYLSRAHVSGLRAVMSVVPPGGGGRVCSIDLTTRAVSVVTPPDMRAHAWSFDGSVIGLQIQPRGGMLEAAWCDLDERPTPDEVNGDDPTPSAPASRASRTVTGESAEPTDTPVTDEDTTTPEPEAPADIPTDEPNAPDASDPEPGADATLPLPWMLGGLAGLVVLGAAGVVVRNRAARRT
jgi:hypothetical protein